MSAVMLFVVLLSAVVVVNALKLVCGFVGFTARLLIRGFQSVLDFLNVGKGCVRVLLTSIISCRRSLA